MLLTLWVVSQDETGRRAGDKQRLLMGENQPLKFPASCSDGETGGGEKRNPLVTRVNLRLGETSSPENERALCDTCRLLLPTQATLASLALISWVDRSRRKRGGGRRARISRGVAKTARVSRGSAPSYLWQPGRVSDPLRVARDSWKEGGILYKAEM